MEPFGSRLLGAALGQAFTFGSEQQPAPQATLMKTVIDGVLSGSLPWGLVGTGATFSLAAMLAGLPGLAFAVGIYLPLGSLTPIFLGGGSLVDRRRGEAPAEGNAGILAASGLIAGEGLSGVAIAMLVAIKSSWKEGAFAGWLDSWRFAEKGFVRLEGALGLALGLVLVAAISLFLYRAGNEGEGGQS